MVFGPSISDTTRDSATVAHSRQRGAAVGQRGPTPSVWRRGWQEQQQRKHKGGAPVKTSPEVHRHCQDVTVGALAAWTACWEYVLSHGSQGSDGCT